MSNIFFDTLSGLPVLFIRDFYSELELSSIFEELIFLSSNDRFKDPTHPDGPSSATTDDVVLKSAKGMYLDVV